MGWVATPGKQHTGLRSSVAEGQREFGEELCGQQNLPEDHSPGSLAQMWGWHGVGRPTCVKDRRRRERCLEEEEGVRPRV